MNDEGEHETMEEEEDTLNNITEQLHKKGLLKRRHYIRFYHENCVSTCIRIATIIPLRYSRPPSASIGPISFLQCLTLSQALVVEPPLST